MRISKAQKWASLAKIMGHETVIHSLHSCQGGICKMKKPASEAFIWEPLFYGCIGKPKAWVSSDTPLAVFLTDASGHFLIRSWALQLKGPLDVHLFTLSTFLSQRRSLVHFYWINRDLQIQGKKFELYSKYGDEQLEVFKHKNDIVKI